MAAASLSWALDCAQCESQLAGHDHLEFLQESERAVHLGLRRHCFEEIHEPYDTKERTLRSKTHPAGVSLTKIPQEHVGKLEHAPFTIRCPTCYTKIGSEMVMTGWAQPEYLVDAKACRVSIQCASAVSERVHNKKPSQLLKLLEAKNLQPLVRSPTSSASMTDDSDTDEDTPDSDTDEDIPHVSARPQTRTKTRMKRGDPMVWPTPESLRELFAQTRRQTQFSTLRDYQLELVLGALLENSIIYLPTGCGKTLVAVRVMSMFKHLNPTRKVAFLVPTGPLVGQQASYLRRESDLEVVELSGQHSLAKSPTRRKKAVMRADALVSTPQFFENMLSNGEIALDLFCVLVFDEAHHAIRNSPYCDVLKRVPGIEAERRPRLVGLTASPFGERMKTLSVTSNSTLQKLRLAYTAKLDTPTLCESLHRLSSAFKEVEFAAVEQTEHAKELHQATYRHIRGLAELLCELSDDGSMISLTGSLLREDADEDSSDCSEDVYVLCGKLRKLQKQLCGKHPAEKGYRADLAGVFVHMRRILMMLPRVAIYSTRYFAEELRDYFLRVQTTEPELDEKLRPLYTAHFGAFLQRVLASPSSGKWEDEVSSKVQAVAKVVLESNIDRHSRAIVFVRRRKTAILLAEAMAKVPILQQLNPTRFIGHNSFEGMTWEQEQRPTLERFRQGRIRLLVATSVLEEGLDVPECSLVIRFDGVTGMTSLVQSRGRARQSSGRFVVMCSDEKRLKQMIETETAMLKMARVEAQSMASKAIPTVLMNELAANTSYEPNGKRESSESSLAQAEIDWSQVDTKLCIMFGITESHTDDDLKAVMDAVNGCGCVAVVQADIKFGLLAVEASSSERHGSDYSALYDELCRRLAFRVTGSGRHPTSSLSFWIKPATVPFSSSKLEDYAAFDNGVLIEEPSEPFLRCKTVYRGRFIQRNAFERSEEWGFTSYDARFAKQGSLLVLEVAEQQRYEFDLLAVHERCVWIETTASNEWVLFLTLRNAPVIRWASDQSRDCRDFHMKTLTFAFSLSSTSSTGIRRLRKELIEEGIDVRDTRVNFLVLSDEEPLSTVTVVPTVSGDSDDSTIVSYALHSLMTTWCFGFGGQVPSRIMETIRKMKTDEIRVQAMLRFEPTTTTEEELVSEFRGFIEKQYPALKGLAKLNQRLVLKAIVTPTRILFQRPGVAPPNRVFRHFNPEDFMYVYFRDENRERMEFSNKGISERVGELMQNGIRIGNSHFRFLGCSLSQLRGANCILTVLDPDEVRSWMGDLHVITSPAKYLKRLGQAFSSTRRAMAIHPQVLLTAERDITDTLGRYQFTDGCGEITPAAAGMVATILGIQPVPSAFQIRLGGAKGVLVVSDFVPRTPVNAAAFKDSDHSDLLDVGHCGVRLRQSMVKFQSPHNKLEIVAHASAHSVAYLSRQSILILSDLGIADSVFIGLQDQYMLTLSAMLVSDKLGLQEIRSCMPLEQVWWMDLLYNEISRTQLKVDPYHRRIIHAIYQYKLANTVLRARIPVAKGRTLMGVADFTGTLNYGEVFVQYTERDPSGETDLERLIVLGDMDVLVYRSPAHHPGDLRVLRCRRSDQVPEALSQLRDCIVFPTRGPRPHPDECTGGDLDGDVYTVIWDERLIPPRQNIVDATDLAVEDESTPDEAEQPMDIPRVIDFYLFALEHDILGMASNAHVAVSDSSEYGCLDADAIALAFICSREVDCCRNPAYSRMLQELMPHQYPDFLQNSGKPSYKSQKVLGKMFRRAIALLTHTAPNYGGAIVNEVDEWFLAEGYKKYTRAAREIYQQYKYAIRMVLQSCGAISEAELATGMIIELPSEYKADYFRVGEQARDVFYNTQRQFRELFERVYRGKPEIVKRRIAAAWYHVAYSDSQEDRMLSFPWILADVLITNKSNRLNTESSTREEVSSSLGDLTSAAMEHVASRLQLSLLKEVDDISGTLIAKYHERLQAVVSLRIALRPFFDDQDIGCVLFGSSALLTFEEQSDLDVVLAPIHSLDQLKELAEFATSADGIAGVQLRERTYVPVLSLSLDETWSVEISSARNGPIKTAWFREYMTKYVFFWPAAYFLIKWGKAAGIIRRRCIDGSTGGTMVLPIGFLWMFLAFCIRANFVESIECPTTGLVPVDVEVEMSFWTALMQRTLQASQEPTAARVIIAFFRYFGDLATPPSAFGFTDPLDPQNNTSLTVEHIEIFREKCYVAHHQLVVNNGDLVSLLHHQHDHRRRITLSRALSAHVHRSPEFFASKILRQCGARDGSVKLAFTHHPNALRPDLYVADVVGDGDSVHRVELKIEKIEEQLGAPRTHRPTEGVHHSGCTLLLLEGATQQSEKVAFQRYLDVHHAKHETNDLHQVHLVSFSNGTEWLEHAIGSFTTKFLRQMVKLTHFEKLNPGVARSKAIVRFGHHYLINLPWSFHEESLSLATIEMLEQEFERGRQARELYESVLVARRRDKKTKQTPADDDDDESDLPPNSEHGRPKQGPGGGGGGSGGGFHDGDSATPDASNNGPRPQRPALALEKATAMSSRDRGVAHSFYPMIAPHLAHLLDVFATQRKKMHVVTQSESFTLSIVHESAEFCVRLTPQLQVVKVKTRANRWLSATIKMHQELLGDLSHMDATPDVRLYVSCSEDVPATHAVPQLLERACAQAADGRGVLEFLSEGDASPRVRVSAELLSAGVALSDVVNVRHLRCTTYQSPADGVELRVLRVVEFSVPNKDPREGFVHETRKTECEMVLPALTADVRVDAAYARRFVLAGVELVDFLREHMRSDEAM